MTKRQTEFFEELANKIKGMNNKVDYPLSNRVELNLSKEEVDSIVWLIEKHLEEDEKE